MRLGLYGPLIIEPVSAEPMFYDAEATLMSESVTRRTLQISSELRKYAVAYYTQRVRPYTQCHACTD